MDRSKKLLNNSLILLFGSAFTKGLNFIMAPLFTRWLSTTDYGTFDLFLTYSTLLIPILAFGIHHAVFRFLLDDNSEESITTVNTNAIITNVIGIIIYIMFVTILSILFGNLTSNIIQLTILLLAQTFQNYMCMFVRGIKKLKLYVIMNIACTANILIFVFYFVKILNMGLSGIIFGYSVGYFIGGTVGALVTHSFRYFKLNRINKNKIKEMLCYSIPMIPNSIAWWVVNISDRVIVSATLGATANAILAVAHKIPNLCTTLYDVFQTAWMENAAESIKNKDWDIYFSKMLNTMCQFCISISIIIVSTNFFLYDILFTKNYSIGKYLTPLFALAIIFNALSQTLGSVFIAEYNSKQQGLTMLEAGIINILVHLLLINYIGIYASAVSTIVAYVFLFLIRYKKVKENYKIKIDRKTIALSIFFILCMASFYLNIRWINSITLVFSIVFCAIINRSTVLIIIRKMIKKT